MLQLDYAELGQIFVNLLGNFPKLLLGVIHDVNQSLQNCADAVPRQTAAVAKVLVGQVHQLL